MGEEFDLAYLMVSIDFCVMGHSLLGFGDVCQVVFTFFSAALNIGDQVL